MERAVNPIFNSRALSTRYDAGTNETTGKTIVKTKSYSNVSKDATQQNMFDVAQAISGLCMYDVLEHIDTVKTTLGL